MPQPSLPEAFATPANCAACRWSIRQGSHSFHVASLMLPVAVREPAYAIYAFCRMADDLIDHEEGGLDAIGELHRMLDRIYAGRPGRDFVERGFADVVACFAIPRAVPNALIEGLGWDAVGRSYRSLDDLKAYAVRVAGTVGFMMTLAMGRRDPEVLARACDLGVAMQLTNIARDVGEDAANGRLYLPLDWMEDAGIDAGQWLAAPAPRPQIQCLVARLLGEAEGLYERARSGISVLPRSSRRGIEVARLLYREIGREILRGVDPVTTRAVTTKGQKLRLVAEALTTRSHGTGQLNHPCLAQSEFLVDAVVHSPAPRSHAPIPAWWDVRARSIRMIDLLNGFSARNAVRDSGRTVPRRGLLSGNER